jgi:plasmid stability protein
MARTTIDIDDRVLRELKKKAADEGRTLQAVANDLLKRALHTRTHQPFSLQIQGWAADLQPGVDILDRDSLFDVMNGR